jgi:hypothetical protein
MAMFLSSITLEESCEFEIHDSTYSCSNKLLLLQLQLISLPQFTVAAAPVGCSSSLLLHAAEQVECLLTLQT